MWTDLVLLDEPGVEMLLMGGRVCDVFVVLFVYGGVAVSDGSGELVVSGVIKGPVVFGRVKVGLMVSGEDELDVEFPGNDGDVVLGKVKVGPTTSGELETDVEFVGKGRDVVSVGMGGSEAVVFGRVKVGPMTAREDELDVEFTGKGRDVVTVAAVLSAGIGLVVAVGPGAIELLAGGLMVGSRETDEFEYGG